MIAQSCKVRMLEFESSPYISTYQFPDDILAKACWKFFKWLPNYKEVLGTWMSLQSTEYGSVMLQQCHHASDQEVKRFSKMVHHLSLLLSVADGFIKLQS